MGAATPWSVAGARPSSSGASGEGASSSAAAAGTGGMCSAGSVGISAVLTSVIAFPPGQLIEQDPDWAYSLSTSIPAQCPADGFRIGAPLEREGRSDGTVPRRAVGRRAHLAHVDEDLSEPAVRKSTDRRAITQAIGPDVPRLGEPPVREPLAYPGAHITPPNVAHTARDITCTSTI